MPQGEYLQYGGQAIVEGVMMRSPRYFAIACRAPNQEIVLQSEPLEKTWIGRQSWLKKPFLRGSLALFDAMALGIRAMKFAAGVQLDPRYAKPGEPEERKVPPKSARARSAIITSLLFFAFLAITVLIAINPGVMAPKTAWSLPVRPLFAFLASGVLAAIFGDMALRAIRRTGLSDEDWLAATEPKATSGENPSGGRVQDVAIGASIIFSMFIGIGLFVYLPNLLAQPLQASGWSGTQINLLAGLIKIAIFFGYLTLIGKHPEIEEIFKYHGAEHKAINTLEAEEELTLENCLRQTRLHPRCGTSFAIVVLLLSVIVFTFIPRYPLGESTSIFFNATIRLCLEVVILPFISGTAYEIIRIAGKFKNSRWVKALMWPGLMSQYITTREPEAKHIEVALRSLQAVVDAEREHAAEPVKEGVDTEAARIA
jgi:uncharacterized protein YqhQ